MIDIVTSDSDDAGVTETALRHFYANLGHRVRVARTGAGLTQGALADKLQLTRTSVANIEAGRQRISAYTLAVAAAALDVPVTELLPSALPPTRPAGIRADAPPEHVALVRRLLAVTESSGSADAST